MATQTYNPTAAQWLAQADRFLDPDGAADLKRRLADSLRARAKKVQLELLQLQNELRDLGDVGVETGASARGSEEPAEPKQASDENPVNAEPEPSNLNDLSVRDLVRRFAERNPGATASQFANFVRPIKGDSAAKHIHATLYDAVKPDGFLRKVGDRPNTRYYTR